MDLNLVLRTSLLLAAAGLIARLLRHAAPATRHLLWHCAIVLVLLAPALGPLAPTFQVPFEVPMVPTVPEVPGGLVPTVLEVPMVPTGMVPEAAATITPGTLGTVGTLAARGGSDGFRQRLGKVHNNDSV